MARNSDQGVRIVTDREQETLDGGSRWICAALMASGCVRPILISPTRPDESTRASARPGPF